MGDARRQMADSLSPKVHEFSDMTSGCSARRNTGSGEASTLSDVPPWSFDNGWEKNTLKAWMDLGPLHVPTRASSLSIDL